MSAAHAQAVEPAGEPAGPRTIRGRSARTRPGQNPLSRVAAEGAHPAPRAPWWHHTGPISPVIPVFRMERTHSRREKPCSEFSHEQEGIASESKGDGGGKQRGGERPSLRGTVGREGPSWATPRASGRRTRGRERVQGARARARRRRRGASHR